MHRLVDIILYKNININDWGDFRLQYIKSEVVHSGKYLDYIETEYKLRNDETKIYESVVRKQTEINSKTMGHHTTNAVVMIVLNKEHTKMLINKEFRLSVNDWVYNLPAGLIDRGESVEEALRRELKEETGLDIVRVIRTLPASFCSIGESNTTTILSYIEATGTLHNDGNPVEEIEPFWIDKGRAREILKSDRITSRTQVLLDMWVNGV